MNGIRQAVIVTAAVLALIGGVCGAEPIAMGTRLEPFVDEHVIESLAGARLKLHEPVNRGKVIEFDRPYEGRFTGYVTVINDGDVYRMYYRGMPGAGQDYSKNEVTCYAESDDGITWRKPDLGLYEVSGSKANNVILADTQPFSHNFSPFLDTNPACPPEERYKAVAGSHETGLHVFTSPDGIHWTKRGDDPIITEGAFDSQNVAFWSEKEEQYLCYFRTWSETKFGGFRSVSRSTSPDFETWSDPEPMTFGGTPREHLYTNQTHPYFRAPHIYIALPMRFMPGRQVLTAEQAKTLGVHVGERHGYASDCADGVFMTTRGGTAYDRTFMEALIRPGTDLGNWASRAGMTALGVVATSPTEMSLYKQAHYAQPSAHLLRYSLRTDGFVSVHGPYGGGTMTTKPLALGGERLVINFATSAAGHVRIALQDGDGEAIPGYTLDDADMIIGDIIERTVTWNGEADLPEVSPIRLHVELKDADLYSVRAAE